MKNVLQTDSQKRDKESTNTYLTALSNKTVKKVGGEGGHRSEKNEYLKLIKESNIRTMVLKIVVIIYLIEAFKVR